MNTAYLGLGSNLGDREANLEAALGMLSERMTISNVSSVYETAPVGFADQPWFLNLVCRAVTGADACALLEFAKVIERRLGRSDRFRNGPREIDIDVLLFNDDVIETDTLIVPHPRMAERAFVLLPLEEVGALLVHPVSGKTIRQLRSELADSHEVRRWGYVSSFGS